MPDYDILRNNKYESDCRAKVSCYVHLSFFYPATCIPAHLNAIKFKF